MKRVSLLLLCSLAPMAAAEPGPGLHLRTRITHESPQGTQEFQPRLDFTPGQGGLVEVGQGQTLPLTPPKVSDPRVQQIFQLFGEIFASQALPQLQALPQGEPLRLELALPNLKEKWSFEVDTQQP